MPLFMFMSGFVFYWSCDKHELRTILINRFRGIGIPLLSWGILQFMYDISLEKPKNVISYIKMLKNSIVSIWFLWAVLSISCAVAIIYKYRDRLIDKVILGILMVALLYILPGRTNNFFMIPFFILGFIFCKYGIFERYLYIRFKWLYFLIWLFMLIFYGKRHYIYTTGIFPSGLISGKAILLQFEIDLFRYLIGLFGTIAIIELLRLIFKKINMKNLSKLIVNGGRRSLDIYVMQRVLVETIIANAFVNIVDSIGENYLTSNLLCYNFVITLLFALICYIFLLGISTVLNKNAVVSFVLFGRKKGIRNDRGFFDKTIR